MREILGVPKLNLIDVIIHTHATEYHLCLVTSYVSIRKIHVHGIEFAKPNKMNSDTFYMEFQMRMDLD